MMYYFDLFMLGENILKFGHRPNFGTEKMLVHIDRHVIFALYFDHIWQAILYRAWSCAGHVYDVYKAYRINHILYKKFLVKPTWVKIRQILGGQYCPPALDLTLIWKLGPDNVNYRYLYNNVLGNFACPFFYNWARNKI